MKKILFFILLGLTITAKAQEGSVEKSMFSVQTGFAGLWLSNELRLSNSIALRSEIGIEYDFAVGDHYDEAGFILQPVITVEPRYYYNLEKRNANGKKTAHNSGNYLSLRTSYHPDWFVINLDDDITKTADLSIIPTWGMKRSIGNHFTYEAGAGLGLRFVFLKANSYNGNAQNVDGFNTTDLQYTPYLHLRIGYVF
ncbi:hypothetical protein EV144_103455 [Flavobacterium sp. 270]|uniref:hypothetical protein n=1 Tax=Flavobacterium sp. 270 TaxID=2512114 RepID=UPI00106519FF|nr:hypothetical protein [Flavobacterium sp. 270]TDW48935.1 hypothetical protein EV144_103455 [Flavobacterium sp. 270]